MARAASPPETSALKHQGYRLLNRGLFPVCDRCAVREHCEDYQAGGTCRPAAQAQADLERELLALPGIDRVRDGALVAEYARVKLAIDVVDLHLAAAGLVLPGATPGAGGGGYVEVQPAATFRLKLSGRLQALADALGLSPSAAHRLKANNERGPAAGIMQAFRTLEAEDAAERLRREAVDADFTTQEATGDTEGNPAGADMPGGTEDAPGGAGPTEGEDTEGGADQ